MTFPILLVLLASASVKGDQTALRNGCSVDADLIASLPAGTSLDIKFALSGESVPCYKVSADVGGKSVNGFMPASAIDGLEEFDKSRKEAKWVGVDATKALEAIHPSIAPHSLNGVATHALDLIKANHPLKALTLLEPEMKLHRDPTLLGLAGIAEWRSDDPHLAMDYLRRSLDLAPNSELEDIYKQVQREAQSDKSNDRMVGMRVLLRYENPAVSSDIARRITGILDDEIGRISTELGCSTDERMIAIAQSPDAYRKTTAAAEWSGGQFDGRIRIPVTDGKTPDLTLRKTLAHEATHACLATLGQWPAWLHEGIAQKMSGESLTPAMKEKLAGLAREGKLVPLDKLGQDWSGMDTEHATIAYAEALDAVEIYCRDYSAFGLRNLLRNPEKLPQIGKELTLRLAQ